MDEYIVDEYIVDEYIVDEYIHVASHTSLGVYDEFPITGETDRTGLVARFHRVRANVGHQYTHLRDS